MTEESKPQASGDSEPNEGPASIAADVEQTVADVTEDGQLDVPDATAPAVVVNVDVVQHETPTETATEMVETAAVAPEEAIESTSAESDTTSVAESAGDVVTEPIEPPEPTELESLAADREREAIRTAELQNERLEIENEAARRALEEQQHAVQEIEVSADGRSTKGSVSEGSGETGTPAGTGSSEGGGSGSEQRAESQTGSSHRESGREPRSRRFKRGRH